MKNKIKKIYYRKLIRDKIPQRIEESGGKYRVEKLKLNDFKKRLLDKVGEEATGLLVAKDKKGITSELGDVLDVVDEIKKVFKISDKELSESRKIQMQRKGGFKDKTFLIWSEDTGYKTNERKGKNK